MREEEEQKSEKGESFGEEIDEGVEAGVEEETWEVCGVECVFDAGADALCADVVGVCGVFGLDGGETDGEGMGERGFYSLSFYVMKARFWES